MFPVDTEARAMCTALPGNCIGELELPGKIVIKPRPPDKQPGLCNVNPRRAEAQTARTILLRRGGLPRAGEEVGKTELITSVGRKTLVKPSRLWSAQADWRFHAEGYAAVFPPTPTASEKARLPSCE